MQAINGLTVYGPLEAAERSPLVAFNVGGVNPVDLATRLDRMGVEARAGCHCATLAHRDLGMTPPASCRLSFALYSTADDVDRAVGALRAAAGRLTWRGRPAGHARAGTLTTSRSSTATTSGNTSRASRAKTSPSSP